MGRALPLQLPVTVTGAASLLRIAVIVGRRTAGLRDPNRYFRCRQEGAVDLHPYDNVERRYRHTDGTHDEGRVVVAEVLGLPEPPAGVLLFDMSFFSGGIGVLDDVAISAPANPALWSNVVKSLTCRTVEEADADETWREDVIWFLTLKEERLPMRPAAVRFINQERREFQTECLPTSRILIKDLSDVNDWVILWGDDARLNYLGHSQG
jgi:hypothetical protein